MQDNVQLTLINDQATVTSIQIAEHFHKRHADVIRAIDNLECSPEFHERNFALMVNNVEIGSGATRQDKAFTLTRDGFAFLCMGFTGKDAAQWKERYIAAFNAMEKEVQRLHAENQALLKWNLTNSHVAITTLQDDNGVERVKARLPLQIEEKKLALLEKQNEKIRLKIEMAHLETTQSSARESSQKIRKLESDVKMWKEGCKTLEERLSTLEHICGLGREDSLELIKKLKLVKS